MNYFSLLISLKYRVFPCVLVSKTPSATSFRSFSLVRLSSSPTSSATSAAGSHGFIDRSLIPIINSLSVCGFSDAMLSLD